MKLDKAEDTDNTLILCKNFPLDSNTNVSHYFRKDNNSLIAIANLEIG